MSFTIVCAYRIVAKSKSTQEEEEEEEEEGEKDRSMTYGFTIGNNTVFLRAYIDCDGQQLYYYSSCCPPNTIPCPAVDLDQRKCREHKILGNFWQFIFAVM